MTTPQLALKHQSAGAGRKGNAMSSRTLKRFVTPPLASLAIVFLLGASTAVSEGPLGALRTVPLPKPHLTRFVRDEATAVPIGAPPGPWGPAGARPIQSATCPASTSPACSRATCRR